MENQEMKKSIFIKVKREIEQEFFVISNEWLGPTKSFATFNTEEFSLSKKNEIDVVKEINIPMPLLNVGDEFLFEDEKEMVKIISVARTDKDKVYYVVYEETVNVNEKYNDDLKTFYRLRNKYDYLKEENAILKDKLNKFSQHQDCFFNPIKRIFSLFDNDFDNEKE